MAGIPPITSSSIASPVTAIPNPSGMRRSSPMAADSYIGTAMPFPIFIDPDMRRAGSDRSRHRMPGGTNGYIDLGASFGDRSCTENQHNKKCQFYHLMNLFSRYIFDCSFFVDLKAFNAFLTFPDRLVLTTRKYFSKDIFRI
jgi:hypothetical protein